MTEEEPHKDADVIAFTDEAGRRGYVRDLTSGSDSMVSVMTSILVPAENVASLRAEVRPLFEDFRKAMPSGSKLHITDAFKPGNEKWRPIAEQVRNCIFEWMQDRKMFLTYSARRLKVAREMAELVEGLKDDAKKQRRSEYVIEGSNRPSGDQIDDDVMINLALMVDAFAAGAGKQKVDFHFDELDDVVTERYRKAIKRTQQISGGEQHVKARNSLTGQKVDGKIEFQTKAPFPLDTQHLGDIVKVGKLDPLVLVADVVCNSLFRHLDKLPADAALNEASSVQGWALASLTFCAPKESVFDKV